MSILSQLAKKKLFRAIKFYRGNYNNRSEEMIKDWILNQLQLSHTDLTETAWRTYKKAISETLRTKRGTVVDAAGKIAIGKKHGGDDH